jgi:hypothetical protein
MEDRKPHRVSARIVAQQRLSQKNGCGLVVKCN